MSDKKNHFNTDITDEDELDEIKKIAEMLNPDEKVLVVARQSRFKPGGSQLSPMWFMQLIEESFWRSKYAWTKTRHN